MFTELIDSQYITVVLQGPTCRGNGDAETDLGLKAIQSIRTYLPNAEIIVSTWQADSVEGFGECVVIRSQDPGGMPDINGLTNNINRQLVSTLAGVKRASRPYVLKLRADHYLIGNRVATIATYPEQQLTEYRLFTRPITMSNLYIRKATKYPFLFHLSDIVQFGTKEDMLLLWDGDIFKREEVFLPPNRKNSSWGNFAGPTNLMHVPEQSLMLRLLRKNGLFIHQPYLSYTTKANLVLWERILVTNFCVLNWQDSGVKFPERFTNVTYVQPTIYTEQDIAQIRESMIQGTYDPNYVSILLNKYIFSLFNLNAFVPLMASLLFKASPRLAFFVRGIWKRVMGTAR